MTWDTTTIILVVLIALGLLIMVLGIMAQRRAKPKTGRKLGEDGSPYVASQERPYMAPPEPEPAPAPVPIPVPVPVPAPEPKLGRGVPDEIATAATDVAGEVLGVEVSGPAGPADDLAQIKGVGPKFVARLNELGIARFDQLAGMNETEAAHLDERLGPFQGRLARDRVLEQADLLARGDVESFEEKFGKLG
jgi:predicted flap endonuclease-1-like 5' DNA nuclease